MTEEAALKFNEFIQKWDETPENNRKAFLHLKNYLSKKEGVVLDFISRPGITYSLRAVHDNQKEKDLFGMVDVIEDNPRWLSVCFYGEMIADPEEKGDYVPEGLLGEDAICFDIDEWEDSLIRYVETRLDEACSNAAKN